MITYKDAGVDVERGYEAVRRMKQHVAATFDENVLGGLGSFGGFYSIENENVEKPVLVAGTDGVGTKLKLAFLMDKHDTVGIDCVAMCVNDVVCQGAKPLIFLDYIATGYLDPVKVEQIVAGVADGCRQAGCALIGGETAEMPDFYPRANTIWRASPSASSGGRNPSPASAWRRATCWWAWPPPACTPTAILWCASWC